MGIIMMPMRPRERGLQLSWRARLSRMYAWCPQSCMACTPSRVRSTFWGARRASHSQLLMEAGWLQTRQIIRLCAVVKQRDRVDEPPPPRTGLWIELNFRRPINICFLWLSQQQSGAVSPGVSYIIAPEPAPPDSTVPLAQGLPKTHASSLCMMQFVWYTNCIIQKLLSYYAAESGKRRRGSQRKIE